MGATCQFIGHARARSETGGESRAPAHHALGTTRGGEGKGRQNVRNEGRQTGASAPSPDLNIGFGPGASKQLGGATFCRDPPGGPKALRHAPNIKIGGKGGRSNAVEANYAWQKWCNMLSMCSSSSNSSLSLAALNATRTPATSTTRIAKWRRAAGGGGGQQRRPAGGGGGRRRRARFRGSDAARLPCELPTRPPPAWFGRFLNSYQVIELSVADSQVMLVRFQ